MRQPAIYKTGFLLALALIYGAREAAAERTPFSIPLVKQGFEKIAERAGVTVYKHPKSEIIRLGAEGRFKAPPQIVRDVLLDYERQKGRVGRVSESKILARIPDNLLVYQRLNLPVISDRDFTLWVKWGKTGAVDWIEWRVAKKGGPSPRSGIVRVTHHEGSWQLKPIHGGRETLARFQVIIDLAGWLPKWLARSGSGKEIPDLFTQIAKMIPKVPSKKSPTKSEGVERPAKPNVRNAPAKTSGT